MDLPHQHVGWYLMELDVLEEVADHVLQISARIVVAVLLSCFILND